MGVKRTFLLYLLRDVTMIIVRIESNESTCDPYYTILYGNSKSHAKTPVKQYVTHTSNVYSSFFPMVR